MDVSRDFLYITNYGFWNKNEELCPTAGAKRKGLNKLMPPIFEISVIPAKAGV